MAFEEDEVGAIDTGDESAGLDTSRRVPAQEDNSGMGPVGAIDTNDNSGMGPVAPGGAPSAPQEDRTGPNGPIMRNLKAFPGNAKRIIGYLMGEGAADPMQLQQAAASVDPEGRMSPDDRNVVAIQKVAQEQGPEAAWKLAQANRVAYNAKQAFGFAALNGTAQKMPDVNAAIDAANQAASHVLDGSSVKFAPAQGGGVTATVISGGETQTIPLSLEQFRQYMNVGGAGQYDRVTQETIPATLAMLAQGGGAQRRRGPQPPRPQPTEADSYKPPAVPSNFGKTPSTQNLSGDDNVSVQPPSDDEKAGYSEQLRARANLMAPGISREEERQKFMASEEQREAALQNKVDVEETKGKYGTAKEEVKGGAQRDVANIKGSAWRYASDHKLQAAQVQAAAKAAAEGDKNARAAIENARKAIATKHATLQPLTEDEKAMEKQLATQGLNARPGQQQAPAAPRQAPTQQAPQRAELSPKDQQALAWANANPNDPRAAKIKSQLGVQ